jgi:hypothetical protein
VGIPGIQEYEAGRLGVHDHPVLHCEMLSQKTKQNKTKLCLATFLLSKKKKNHWETFGTGDMAQAVERLH